MYCRNIFLSFVFVISLANSKLIKDHSNVGQYSYYDDLGNQKIESCPDKMIFNETLGRCVQYTIPKRSKRQSVLVGSPCNENIDCITLDDGGAYCSPLKRCDCLPTSININSYCWRSAITQFNPGQTGCRYNEQCSSVWPGATCTSNACQCPNGQPHSRTSDGAVCNSAGMCPINGQYSKLKNADGTDAGCTGGSGLFFPMCPNDGAVLDYDCLCTPASSRPDIGCGGDGSIAFCCPTRALACIMPKEEGISSGGLPQNKFFYNPATSECETLSYNGIGGNANNFNTKQQCESYCKTACPRGRPLYIPAPDTTDDSLRIATIQTCISSTANPCGTNDFFCNDGDTRQTNSNNYCCPTATSVCRIQFGGQQARVLAGVSVTPNVSPNTGQAVPNLPARTRFYYDEGLQSCRTFQYLGAGGNYNNFATESECLTYCSTSVCEAGDVLRDINLRPIVCASGADCPGRYTCTTNRCCPSKEFVCSLPNAVGACNSLSRKWWFNPDTRTCQEFTYNGCQGNFNRFDTFNLCQTYCGSSDTVPKCPQGDAYRDTSTNLYTICFGTSTTSTVSNCPTGYYCNFDGIRYGCCPSKSQTCEVEGITLPVSTACVTPVSRWGYNATSRQCAQFTYNGCDGNSNNFATQLDCQDYCGVGGCKEGGGEPFKETSGQYRICTANGNECLNGYICTQVSTVTSNVNNYCCQTRDSVCRLSRDEGSSCGITSLNRFYFNPVTRNCESLVYKGCGGNRNNFKSAAQCLTYCSSAACAPGQVASTDPSTNRLITCQPSTTLSSSGCGSGYTCISSSLLNQGVCCGSNAPAGTCPTGQSAFIDSFTSTPLQCLQNADGQCPLTPNRFSCVPSFTSGSNFCCATVVVQCSRGGRVGTDVLGNPAQCTPNIPNNCASGFECQPITFPTGDFTSASGYCCGTPNPCGRGFNTLFSNNNPVTCDATLSVNSCSDPRYLCIRTETGQGYCCISAVNAVNPCSAGKNPYQILNQPTVCIPGSGNTGAGCPVGYTCDMYEPFRTTYCCTSSGILPPPGGASTCPSGSPLSTSCTINSNCGVGFVCKPGTGSSVCCPSPASACSQTQTVGLSCTTASPSQRYSYNPSTRSCTSFTYLGCGANGNNFFSAQACEEFCMPALCTRGRPQYVTGGSVQSCTTAAQCNPGFQCTPSQFGGGGLICCQTSASVCALAMDPGRPCSSLSVTGMQMWYFNSATRTCMQYSFNGCGGNPNSFETQSECSTFCGGTVVPLNPCPSPRTAQTNTVTNQPVACIGTTCGIGFQCIYSPTASNYYCCSRVTAGGSNGCPSGSAYLYPRTNSPLGCTIGGPRCPNNYACMRSTSFAGSQCCSSTVSTVQAATMPVIRCTSHEYCRNRLKSPKATCNLSALMCSCDSSESFANNVCGAKMSG